jgi:hypothetical protein
MSVVIEICVKYPGGRTRIKGADMHGAHACMHVATSAKSGKSPKLTSFQNRVLQAQGVAPGGSGGLGIKNSQPGGSGHWGVVGGGVRFRA